MLVPTAHDVDSCLFIDGNRPHIHVLRIIDACVQVCIVLTVLEIYLEEKGDQRRQSNSLPTSDTANDLETCNPIVFKMVSILRSTSPIPQARSTLRVGMLTLHEDQTIPTQLQRRRNNHGFLECRLCTLSSCRLDLIHLPAECYRFSTPSLNGDVNVSSPSAPSIDEEKTTTAF
ncbi:hypothetical protein KP509_21G034400 [Ceratopteris richardii]|uniref:Uncharacterized protein n=1 Tax=Ceratopteris richardii TaxID=49495 RepID=A0A8T2SAR7_CERRI|nr:hypothetical protein KP509_21G034200 [Ceratopteris richardii]KAH7315102.1 hypothetical protein KP509_21G034400 [Ceratopteris richardii]